MSHAFPINVLIVDDEALARTRLRAMVESLPGYRVAGEASDGRSALEQYQHLVPDIVLLDIRMPGMDGIETAGYLARLQAPPALIFVTAYGDHALEAFAVQALDYLVKPIRLPRLEEALKRARRLQPACLPATPRRYVLASSLGKLQIVALTDVLCFVADQGYVTVHHRGGEVLIEESLKSLEQEYGADFTRIHRNALVADAAVVGLDKTPQGLWKIRLEGGRILEISRRHLPQVRRRLKAMGHTA